MDRGRTKKMVAVVALALFVSAMMLPSARAGQVIDRIVATVNGHIILQSDWDEALCYEALLNGRALNQFTDDDRRSVLDRLIDHELLGEQMKSASFEHASESEAAAGRQRRGSSMRKRRQMRAGSWCWAGSGYRKKIWLHMCSSRSISCDWSMLTFVPRCRLIPKRSKPITGRNSYCS